VYSSGPSPATPRLQRRRTRSPQQPTLFLTRSTAADGAAAAGSSPTSACSSSSTSAPRQSLHQPRRCHDQEDPHLHRPRVRCHRSCWRPGVGANRLGDPCFADQCVKFLTLIIKVKFVHVGRLWVCVNWASSLVVSGGAAASCSSPMSACSSSSTGAPRQSPHQPRRCHDQEDPHLHRPRVRCHRCCWRPGVGADRLGDPCFTDQCVKFLPLIIKVKFVPVGRLWVCVNWAFSLVVSG
jgi:hypothetical protein